MAKQVAWTKDVFERFCEYGMLNDDDRYIMESRISGTTVTAQAQHLHCSEASIARRIKRLKVVYDKVQEEHPDIFPKRKYSASETYMDTH